MKLHIFNLKMQPNFPRTWPIARRESYKHHLIGQSLKLLQDLFELDCSGLMCENLWVDLTLLLVKAWQTIATHNSLDMQCISYSSSLSLSLYLLCSASLLETELHTMSVHMFRSAVHPTSFALLLQT